MKEDYNYVVYERYIFNTADQEPNENMSPDFSSCQTPVNSERYRIGLFRTGTWH